MDLGFLLLLQDLFIDASLPFTCSCEAVNGFGGSGNSPFTPTMPNTALRMSRPITGALLMCFVKH